MELDRNTLGPTLFPYRSIRLMHLSKSFPALLLLPIVTLGGMPLQARAAIAPAAGLETVPQAVMTSSPVQPAHQLIARQNVKRIQFAPGKSAATAQNSVIRGDQDVYLLGARKGQTMTLSITSLENNAVFEVLTPPDAQGKRRSLKQEVTTWKGVLPANGDYLVVVAGTRGNATYKLQVTIK